MRCYFGVDGEPRRAGGGEIVEVALRLQDHHVHVERQRRRAAQGLDDLRAEGEVRHEPAVHDVHVNPIRSCLLEHRHLVGEPAEVRAQDGRGDSCRAHGCCTGGGAGSGEGSIGGGGSPTTRSCTVVPATTGAPPTGVCPITVPGSPGPLGSRTICTLRMPICVRTCRAAPTSRPMTSGIEGAGAPPLRMIPTVDGTLTAEPASGRVPMTVPRGALLGASLTSPTSNPSFSSRTCASIRVIPVTVGRVTMRCPPLMTSVILPPTPSRAPGGSDCSR